jgi:hypothetical protein
VVIVKAVAGTWFYSDYNERNRRAEVHRITIAEQEGSTVRGVYATVDEPDQAFSGTVSAERNVHLALTNQSVQFQGLVSSDISSDWLLTFLGGRTAGQTLSFHQASSEPMGSSPAARLAVTFDHRHTQGPNHSPVAGVTEITFDASGSGGDQLSYIIEYGDGDVSREAISVHAVLNLAPTFPVARVTVTDRFGRFAVASQPFGPVTCLCTGIPDYFFLGSRWENKITNAAANRDELRVIQIRPEAGLTISGRYWHPEGTSSSFTGTLDGHGGIVMTLVGGGITFSGSVDFVEDRAGSHTYRYHLRLTARGGSADGLTLNFVWIPYDYA